MSLRKFWTFFGRIFFGTGLIVLLVGLYATYHAYGDAERLSQEGQVAEGIVLERKIETHQAAGRNAGPTESYSLVYRFTTADGQTFTAEAGVDRATWDRLVERSPVRIIYVPGAPGINALAGHEPGWVLALIAPSVGLILSALGGFVLMRVRRQGSDALASDEAAAPRPIGRKPLTRPRFRRAPVASSSSSARSVCSFLSFCSDCSARSPMRIGATRMMEPPRAAQSRESRSSRPMRVATARRAISPTVTSRPLRERRSRAITRSRSPRGSF